jgi:glycosyltransferase involved in cell wall biosynthesis
LAPLVTLLVWAGRQIGHCLPLHNPSGLFFFFPFYHTGGAEKVHADIVSCFAVDTPWVFFAKRSSDNVFLAPFRTAARCFDCGWLLKYTYPLSTGILAGLINKYPNAQVFGCNSLFFYLLLPHLSDHVRATDLLHGLGGGAEQFALPVVAKLAERVVISFAVRDELLDFYQDNGVSPSLNNRITVIPNRVEVPIQVPQKSQSDPMKVLFVGRGSEEKRIHLIGQAARHCAEKGINAHFTLVGDVDDWLEDDDADFCYCAGVISDFALLQGLYAAAHLVVIVSSREGFPLAVMEGMAQGCVPVCTAVGGIPEHIRHAVNGWLLPTGDDQAVVGALCEAITRLSQDSALLSQLYAAAYLYARQQFGGEQFCEAYRKVITGR